jgi:hypothetical protein
VTSDTAPTSDEVLDAYGLEPANDGPTLCRYLEKYPKYAEDLVDFSRELMRGTTERETPLSAEEEAFINTAWATFAATRSANAGAALLDLPMQRLRDLAAKLEFPLQVMAAFRARRVQVATVPRRVLATMAVELRVATEVFAEWLAGPVLLEEARSYKSDSKPAPSGPVPLRQLLAEAGVPEVKIEELLAKVE